MSRANLLVGRNIQENGPSGAILFYLRARADNERFFSVPISKSQYTKGVIKGNVLDSLLYTECTNTAGDRAHIVCFA